MSIWKAISDIGGIITLIGFIAIIPGYFALTANMGNPDFPALELTTSMITAIVLLMIPTSALGIFFMFADEMASQ